MSERREETVSPPASVLVTGYFKEQYGYATYRPRGSGNWLVTYTLQGEGLYRQQGLEMRALPGDMVLLRPGAEHDYSVPSGGSWEFLWAHFQPRVSWLAWWQWSEVGYGLYKAYLSAASVRDRVLKAFLKLHADAGVLPALNKEHNEEVSVLLQRELAINGLEEVMLLAAREQRQKQRNLDPRIQTVLTLMSEDLAAPHSLESLASAVALSPSRLAHLFKLEVGDSITQMLIDLRLNKAARLLEFTNYSVGIIAEETGFHSIFYLSRQFRRRFGVSPQGYRARLTGNK
jgi:AraC family transcriptional regulator of arabinose operon